MPNRGFFSQLRAKRLTQHRAQMQVQPVEPGDDQQIQTPLRRLIDKFELKGPRLVSRLSTRIIPVTTTDPSEFEVFRTEMRASTGFSTNSFYIDAAAVPIGAGGLIGAIRTLGPPGWYIFDVQFGNTSGVIQGRAEVFDNGAVVFLGHLLCSPTYGPLWRRYHYVSDSPDAVFRVVNPSAAVINAGIVMLDYTTRRVS